MLIKRLLDFVTILLEFLLGWINIPDMPQAIVDVMEQVKTAMISGLNIFGFFVDITIFRVCCSIFILLFITEHLWDFIKWIMRKIPFMNMS